MPQETRALKQSDRHNPERFPVDFMFELDTAKVAHLVSQTVIPSSHRGFRHGHLAFTEQGVAKVANPA